MVRLLHFNGPARPSNVARSTRQTEYQIEDPLLKVISELAITGTGGNVV